MKPVLLIALLTSLLWLALAATGAESTADDRTKGEGQAMIDVQPTENKPDRVVMARVGDAEITVEDYIGFISLNPERVRASRGTAGKAEVLRIMIENVLLQQVMAKEGLLRRSRSRRTIRKPISRWRQSISRLPKSPMKPLC
jgi:hypothetical protein